MTSSSAASAPGAPGTGAAHAGPGGVPTGAADDWEHWRRPGPTAHQQRADIGIASLVLLGALITIVLVNSMGAFAFGDAPSLAEQLSWAAAITAPLALRRRFPEIVALVVAGLFIGAQARHVGDNLVPSVALFFALYTLGAWGIDRVRARWVRIGIIVAMFAWLGYSMAQSLMGPVPDFAGAAGPLDPLLASALHSIGFNLLFFLSAYFFGNISWESARRRHELEVQGDRLRRSQEENARQAVVAERLRIARDLHDVVAHHVSVMGVQAAAARRVFESDTEQASRSLGAVEETARVAVGELRSLLGVLRSGRADDDASDEQERPAAPGLDQLGTLVREVQEIGLHTDYRVFGTPRAVPEATALSVYRIAQEALTNTVKHAGASRVDVRVRFLARTLEVEVTDDGRGVDPAHSSGGSTGSAGLGLVGMRERMSVHGGELEVGPRREGGFRVRARFPLPAADAPAQDTAAANETGQE